jgi:mannose-6-phosphate isomerase-like protein (cupin superfamily)
LRFDPNFHFPDPDFSDFMARIVTLAAARELGLPGRVSREIVSGAEGAAAVTLRHVEIPVADPAKPGRTPHQHGDSEECIYVLSGTGAFWTDAGEQPVGPGDTILIPPGEPHYTRNTGSEPLVLLCFFPTAALGRHK